jgi:hypothetical protein
MNPICCHATMPDVDGQSHAREYPPDSTKPERFHRAAKSIKRSEFPGKDLSGDFLDRSLLCREGKRRVMTVRARLPPRDRTDHMQPIHPPPRSDFVRFHYPTPRTMNGPSAFATGNGRHFQAAMNIRYFGFSGLWSGMVSPGFNRNR